MTLMLVASAWISLAAPLSVIPSLPATHRHNYQKQPLVHPAATLSCHSRLLTAKVDLSDARILLQGSRQPRNPFVGDVIACNTHTIVNNHHSCTQLALSAATLGYSLLRLILVMLVFFSKAAASLATPSSVMLLSAKCPHLTRPLTNNNSTTINKITTPAPSSHSQLALSATHFEVRWQ